MTLVLRSLVLALALALAAAVPSVPRASTGHSGANVVFGDTRRGEAVGTSSQFGQTSASSEQRTAGDGQQTNQGEASAVSVQQQTGLGGATQSTSNQGVVQAQQAAGGGGGGGGGGTVQQGSSNQVNIVSNQEQQNVEGTLVNVHGGNEGVVIVNTNRNRGRSSASNSNPNQQQQQQPSYDENTLLKVLDDNNDVILIITVNKTEEEPEEPIPSSNCRYVCIRPTNNTPYCCDDGTNARRRPAIHGGQCPPLRLLCTRNVFFRKCAHDGQCAASDKCCYDDCADHHICKRADPIP